MTGRISKRREHRRSFSLVLSALTLPVIAALTSEAHAVCTPAADNTPSPAPGTVVTCSGTTLNQNPGAFLGMDVGYGTGSQTGVTVKIDPGASVEGTAFGIYIGAGTISVGAGSTVTAYEGIHVTSGSVTNNGSVIATGVNNVGIVGEDTISLINNAGGLVRADAGTAVSSASGSTVTNFGVLEGNAFEGVSTAIDVTNHTGGSISGARYGIVTVSGASIYNAGNITGVWGAIQFTGTGGTLTLAQGSAINGTIFGTGTSTLQLGGTAAASFDMSAVGAAAQYRGFATFNKIGTSVWTLTGTSSFTGPTNVDGGALAVNGSIASSSLTTVNTGGTLGGNGFVGNTTINGGTLAPGNSIGLLAVQGNLVMTAASTYMIEVSPSNADRVNVSGTATLGGATVNAVFAPGSYITKQYTILNATGGLGGTTFSTLVNSNLPSNVTSSLNYDANNVYLDLQVAFNVPGVLNANQKAVADTLTGFFNRTGGIPLAFVALSPSGLTQASGETATGSQQTTFDAMNQFMGVMTDPSIDGRGASVLPAGANGFADDALAYAARYRPSDALAAIYRKAPPIAAAPLQPWSVWAAGYGGSQTTDGNALTGSNTASSRIYGTAIGADYRISPNALVGFALAGGGTSFSVNGQGSGRSDLFQAGAFIRHTVGATYLAGAIAYGWQDMTISRTVTAGGFEQLRAQFNANAFSGRIEAGHRFVAPVLGGVGLTPYAAGQATRFDLPSYAEGALTGTGIFALNYTAKTATATRSELGLRSDKSLALASAILTLRSRAGWAHDFDTDRSVAASFQSLPGATFVVNGAAPARNAALTTASAEIKWANGISLAASFEGEFSDVTRSYAGKGVARYQW